MLGGLKFNFLSSLLGVGKSFMNLRRVCKRWKQTLAKEQSTAALLMCQCVYLILAKVP